MKNKKKWAEYMRRYRKTPQYKAWRKKYLTKNQKKREYRELQNKRYKKYLIKNGDKHKIRQMVRNAVRDGRLEKQDCEVCGDKAEAHHEDYSKPLEVLWLCKKHHMEKHKLYE